MIQTQITTQKEIIESTSSFINDLTFNMNTNIINITNNVIQMLNDVAQDEQTKNKLNMW
jgi:hypothetical protein